MLSENGDVIKIDTTGRQTTRPWVSKIADRRYHVASISRQFRGPIYWNAHASSSFDHAHWGYNSVFKQIRRRSVDGRKRYENDKCGRKSFWKQSKTAPSSFENGLKTAKCGQGLRFSGNKIHCSPWDQSLSVKYFISSCLSPCLTFGTFCVVPICRLVFMTCLYAGSFECSPFFLWFFDCSCVCLFITLIIWLR